MLKAKERKRYFGRHFTMKKVALYSCLFGQTRTYLHITLNSKENQRSITICRLGYQFQMLQIKLNKTLLSNVAKSLWRTLLMLDNITNQAAEIPKDAMEHHRAESKVTLPVVQTLFHIKIITDFIHCINAVKHWKAQLSSMPFTQFTF